MKTIKFFITAIVISSLALLASCDDETLMNCPECDLNNREQSVITGSYIYTSNNKTTEFVFENDGTVKRIYTDEWGVYTLKGIYMYSHPDVICTIINEDPAQANTIHHFIMADDLQSWEVLNNPGWIFTRK